MIHVEFTVPGEPKGKGRHRTRIATSHAGKQFVATYTPKETASYENLVRLMASEAMAGRPPIQEGGVSLVLSVALSVPRSWSGKKQARALLGEIMPTGKPDLDNIEKAVLDGMNKVVFRDDSQVCRVTKSKRYGATPGVHVSVEPIGVDLLSAVA